MDKLRTHAGQCDMNCLTLLLLYGVSGSLWRLFFIFPPPSLAIFIAVAMYALKLKLLTSGKYDLSQRILSHKFLRKNGGADVDQ